MARRLSHHVRKQKKKLSKHKLRLAGHNRPAANRAGKTRWGHD